MTYGETRLVDFEKAFDNIWIPGLISKLLNYGFPIYLIILIHNMLNNKCFQVYDGKSISSRKFLIVNGLQQGTVNAPILFNLYIHDLLNKIENIIGFADDIVIYHSDDKIEKINEKLQKQGKTAAHGRASGRAAARRRRHHIHRRG